MRNKPYAYYDSATFDTIWDLLDLAEKRYAEKEAYIFKKKKVVVKKTYADLVADAHALAAYFINEGYARKRLAILAENSYEWIVTWFGIVLSGNIAVPLDKMLDLEHLHFIISNTAASALIYSKQYKEQAHFFKEKYSDMAFLCVDTEFEDRLASGRALLKAKKLTRVPNDFDKNQTAEIIYTSGTTGVAKGVALTQDNLCAELIAVSMSMQSNGSNMLVLPLNHCYAMMTVLVVLNKGQTTYICSGIKRFSQEVKEFAPAELYLVPLFVETMYHKIMEAAKQKGKEKQLKMLIKVSLGLYNMGIDIRRKLFATVLNEFGGNLNAMLSGGAPIDPMYLKAFRAFGVDVMEGYGISECSPVIAANRNAHYRDGSVGQALHGVEVKTDAPDGKSEGELYVRGRIVMQGYFENEDATAETFDGDWFKTGDYGRIDKDGFIYITGRKKNIIILSNGKNLYPEELEQQIMRIPGVKEVIVYEENRAITAEIYPDCDLLSEDGIENHTEHLEAAIEKLNKQLPAGKSITKVKVRDTCFEKTATQKIIRKKYA